MKHSNTKAKSWEDHYTRRAKKERFPARSVFKLKEIQRKFRLIQKGDKVLDLGCAPGSWLLYAAEVTGGTGRIVGIDQKPLSSKMPAHVSVHAADIFTLGDEIFDSMGSDFNVVLSDMAPATTGNKMTDAARSYKLCQAALSIAQRVLLAGGAFVCKIFQGEDIHIFSESVKTIFAKQKIFKPQSSRKASKEIYIIGLGKR